MPKHLHRLDTRRWVLLVDETGFYGGSAQRMMDQIVFATSGQTFVEPYRNDDETKRVADEDGMNSIRRMLFNDRKQLLHQCYVAGMPTTYPVYSRIEIHN